MRTWLWLAGFVATAACTVAACGGDDSATGSGGSGGGNGGSGGQVGGSGGVATTNSGGAAGSTATGGSGGSGGGFVPMCITDDDTVMAVDHLDFGDADANAWKAVGFNIDGKVSDPSSTDLCIPFSASAKAKAYQDGNDGIDNSFGETVLPFIIGAQATFTSDINAGLKAGSFTLMLDLIGLTPDADQPPVIARVYGGADLQKKPKFDGTDCWPVSSESLKSPDLTKPRAEFPMAQIAGNHLTSGVIASLPLVFFTEKAGPITLVLHEARLELDLDLTHESATGGMIGGVLQTDEFRTTLERVAGAQLGHAFCSVVDPTVNKASDILADGTQDTSKSCDGISIGLGFTMKRVKLGGIAPKVDPMPDPCQ